MVFIGIEIGGTKLQLVAGTQAGEVIDRRRLTVDSNAGGEGIRAQIAAALPELVARHQPRAVGVGFGGPVDFRTGRIECSHQVPGWHGFGLGDWLRERLPAGVQVFVDNDANVAALGEARFGAGRGFNPVFWINMGSGIGGGLVVDGSLYHGAIPGEAEIGHLRLDKNGTILEHRCSGWAVDARIREAVTRTPENALGRLVTAAGLKRGEARLLAQAVDAGDPDALRILSEVGEDLAFALSHAIHLFHPSVIVMGGGLSLVGDSLRSAVASALPRFLMDSFQPGPEVRLAGLGEDSVPIGALALAASRLDAAI